jgi:hypothetical protein
MASRQDVVILDLDVRQTCDLLTRIRLDRRMLRASLYAIRSADGKAPGDEAVAPFAVLVHKNAEAADARLAVVERTLRLLQEEHAVGPR